MYTVGNGVALDHIRIGGGGNSGSETANQFQIVTCAIVFSPLSLVSIPILSMCLDT